MNRLNRMGIKTEFIQYTYATIFARQDEANI
jgi:hypothetical protein